MKKAMKVVSRTLLALVVLLPVLFLVARFAFRDRLLARQRVELLRQAGPYAADSVPFRFTYRQDSLRAREIRDYFRLDTLLRPDAATWDNAAALAAFVADHIPHANQHVYPQTCNAIGLWEYSRTVEPAFNCRLHAILLHELLLSAGIANRFVTCLPADPLDADCHVVNVVWLPERRKWAMIDSDQHAFITDPAGTPLSLAEMRQRTIAGERMEVRPIGQSEPFDDMLSYWAKNLYWFICWEDARYDQEVGCEGRTVILRPEGFDVFGVDPSAVMTSDADRFWAAPDTLPALRNRI